MNATPPEAARGPSIRAFVAIHPPPEASHALDEIQRGLRRACSEAPIRWVPSGQIHLTLRFLGNIPETKVESLAARLDQTCAIHPAFELRTAQFGGFPSMDRPSILWLGLDGDLEALRALQQSIEAAVELVARPNDNREFSPHLTLGRVKERSGARRIGRALAGLRVPASVCWRATEVRLMRSELSPSGSRHSILRTFPLKAGA